MSERTVMPDGEKVESLRRMERGWTQEGLAEKAGVARRTIENIESGNPTFPYTLSLVAKALGVELKDIIRYPLRIWNGPHQNPNFVGRRSLLDDLWRVFKSGESPIVTLHGLGGVGKTQLAVEYVYQNANEYELAWWVHSEEPATLAADYAALARELNLPEKDDREQRTIVESVKRWLQQKTGWLLIFDNANVPDDVRNYIPSGSSGHVLITSRNPNWGSMATPICVGVLNREEAVEFLMNRTNQNDHASMNELAEELGDLPLALEQAAAYIEQTGKLLNDYLNLVRIRRKELWEVAKPPLDYPDTVATTWKLAMEKIREECPAAAELLILCAFLAPNDIPLKLFSDGAQYLPNSLAAMAKDELNRDDAIGALRRYSLIERKDETLSVHRLVQAVTRDGLTKEEQQSWSKIALQFINGVFPFKSDDELTWPDSLRILPHALKALEHAENLGVAKVSDKFDIRFFQAIRYDMEGKHGDAVNICQKLLEETSQSDAAWYLQSYSTACVNLAAFYDHQGQQEKALELLDRLISQPNAENQYGENYWWALYQKGIMLRRQKQYEQARKVLNEGYEFYKKKPKKDYLFSFLHQLGVIDLEQGRSEDAEAKFNECLEGRRNEKMNFRLAYEYRRRGQVYAKTGRLDKALDDFNKAKEIAKDCHFQRYVQEIEADIRKYCSVNYLAR